ncbi:MAG: hypothetical protein QM426_11480 [Euryarchaeota archaeon]|nr:hypothetical protein [Euryarchaeota archaeon]
MSEIEKSSNKEELRSEKQNTILSDLGGDFKKGVFVIAMLFLLVATVQIYSSIEQIIGIWFEYQYIPIFRAVYNFIILLICLYIIRLYIIKR